MAKSNHEPVPRYLAYAGPAILARGFRPFFLLAGIWAPLALLLSLGQILGHIALPTGLDAVSWHFHELLFGSVSAALAGFLLTAIPNWTGRLPLQGAPLLILVLIWLAGRVAVAIADLIGHWLAAAIDISFLAVLAGVAFREIIAGRNWRNLPIIMAIIILCICNMLFYAEVHGIVAGGNVSWRLAIAAVTLLVSLVGGRIIPSFSRNWLAKRHSAELPAPFRNFDRFTLSFTLIALCGWAFFEEGRWVAGMLALACVLNFARLTRWRGWAVRNEPLLWILHFAFLWIPVGLMLLALYSWVPGAGEAGALHALTIGAIGTMTLAVMSRATLGHTGRPLHAGKLLTIAYSLMTTAAIARIGSALFTEMNMPLVILATFCWVGAFVAYLAKCGPMLIKHRLNGR